MKRLLIFIFPTILLCNLNAQIEGNFKLNINEIKVFPNRNFVELWEIITAAILH